ncbi:hypothetical protein ACS0TY_006719 [Phlomoides rotata]
MVFSPQSVHPLEKFGNNIAAVFQIENAGIIGEGLKQSLMDCQSYCASSLTQIWIIETLACSNQIDVSLLLGLLEKTPEISTDIGRNARELVSLKILEKLFIQGARANPVSPFRETISLDPSDRCEDVLRRIMSKISLQHLKYAGLEVSKWDLKPFIEHKRLSLPIYALKKLKDAINTGSHSILASLKEQSSLPVGNHAEREAPVKDGNCNGITPRVAGNDTNDSFLLPRGLPDQNLVRVNRKRRTTSETAAEELCITHNDTVKKYKCDIICTEQHQAGNLISSVVDRRVADKSVASVEHNKGKSFVLQRKSHVGSMQRSEPFKEDNNEFTSSKGLVGPDEVMPGEKQAAHCVTELSDKSDEQGQNQNVEEAKDNKKGFSDLERANDGNDDDRTGIARMENVSFGSQCTKDQDSLTATCRDQNLLAGTSKIYSGEGRCILEKTTRVEVIGENGHSGDGYTYNRCTSSKGLVGNDEVPYEKQATEVSDESSDLAILNSKGKNAENVRKCFNGLMTMNEGVNKFDQNIPRIVPTVGEAEDANKPNDTDGYQDERSNIDTKKKIFLCSQCTYGQDSLATTDWRELHLCMKCNKGGELLSCSSGSCPLVIHESCLGSDASFDTSGKFYCPFCAYSRAISKYMEVKGKVSLTRKDLVTFICLEPQLHSREHSEKSFGIEGNHLQQTDELPKSNELNQRDGVEKASNHHRGKKLEIEQVGPSKLRSSHSLPFGRKTVGSTKRLAQSLDKENEDGKSIRKVSKSTRVKGRKQTSALEIRNIQDETTSTQVSETSGSEKHADMRSKKGLLCPSETNLPCKQKSSRSAQSSDAIVSSESTDAAKNSVRVRKQVRQNLWPTIPQMRRVRLPWMSREENKLKEGMQIHCGPHDKVIPWKQILEHGVGVFQPSRTTTDLKDKWRNMCKASPNVR